MHPSAVATSSVAQRLRQKPHNHNGRWPQECICSRELSTASCVANFSSGRWRKRGGFPKRGTSSWIQNTLQTALGILFIWWQIEVQGDPEWEWIYPTMVAFAQLRSIINLPIRSTVLSSSYSAGKRIKRDLWCWQNKVIRTNWHRVGWSSISKLTSSTISRTYWPQFKYMTCLVPISI